MGGRKGAAYVSARGRLPSGSGCRVWWRAAAGDSGRASRTDNTYCVWQIAVSPSEHTQRCDKRRRSLHSQQPTARTEHVQLEMHSAARMPDQGSPCTLRPPPL